MDELLAQIKALEKRLKWLETNHVDPLHDHSFDSPQIRMLDASGGRVGGFDIGINYIRDVANTFGMSADVTDDDDVRFWAGATFANRATADFRVTKAGAVVAASFTHSGGTVGALVAVALESLNVAARGWTQTSVFSVTDADTVAWGAGTFTSADGTAYLIDGGNTGNMAAPTYIYLNTAVSTTAYQTTTTAAIAVGAGKVLSAKAENGTGEATFQVFGGIGGQNIDAASIVANSITANELSTSITYAGSIVIDTAGLIRSGQTAFRTGTGWYIGNDGGTPKLSIGVEGGSEAYWDGVQYVASNLLITQKFTCGHAVTAGNAVYVSDGITGIVSLAQNATNNSFVSMGRNGTKQQAQSFVLSDTRYIGKVSIIMGIQSGTPTDNVVVALQADNGGEPDGTDIVVSAEVDVQTNDTYDFVFSSPEELTSGTYWAVCRRTGSTDDGHYYSIRTDNTGAGYASGTTLFLNSASAWETQGTVDLVFTVYEILPSGYIGKAEADISGRYQNFIGFATETKAIDTVAQVSIAGIITGLSSLTPSQYYLSDTAGAIATSAGSNTRKVGIAISATALYITNLW